MLLNIYLFLAFTVAILTIISHKLEIVKSSSVDEYKNTLWYINPATLAIVPSMLFIGVYSLLSCLFHSIILSKAWCFALFYLFIYTF